MFASVFFLFLFFFPSIPSPLGLWLISLPWRKTLSLSIPSIQRLEFFDSCLQRPASIWSLFLPENFLPLGTNRWCLEWKAGRYKALPFELTPLPNNWCFSIELRLHLYTLIMHMSLSNAQTQRWWRCYADDHFPFSLVVSNAALEGLFWFLFAVSACPHRSITVLVCLSTLMCHIVFYSFHTICLYWLLQC